MSTKQLLGLFGSLLLFIGVFVPIVSIPIIGSLNYFQNGKGDGTIILGLAVVSLILVLAKQFRGLWFTGCASVALLLLTFLNFHTHLSQMKADMETELADNPFRGLADAAMQAIQLQWGWGVLMVGAALVIAGAAVSEKGSPHDPTVTPPNGDAAREDHTSSH